jgi:hypothetical protein
MLTKLIFALTALALLVAPARADCARTMCEWPTVDEWLSQQRAEAEARARMWQLFGPLTFACADRASAALARRAALTIPLV